MFVMKLWTRTSALALSLALIGGCLTGCSQPRFTAPESIDLTTVTDPYKVISGLDGNTVVATAGEIEITAQELLYQITAVSDDLLQYYSMYGLGDTLPWDTETDDGTLADTVMNRALETAALYALIPQAAQSEALELTQEFKDTLKTDMDNLVQEMGSKEMTDHYLWYFPLTEEMYTHLCHSEEYNTMLKETHFGADTDGYPTDDEVMAYLENDEQCYFFKHILLKVEETPVEGDSSAADASAATSTQTTSNYDAQKALAEDLLRQLQESSNPSALFDQLMKEYTEDPGLYTNPDGYMGSAKDGSMIASAMVPVVEEACLSMEEGEISGVLENQEGYHGFHIVMRLPLEKHVDVNDYRTYYIADQMAKMQDQWLADNPLVTNEVFDSIDPSVVYQSVGVLRDAIIAEAEAAYNQSGEDTSAADTSTAP